MTTKPMVYTMRVILILVFCVTLILCDYDKLCGEDIKRDFTQFEVFHAIRLGDYIGIYGRLTNADKTNNHTVGIRVRYWHQPGVSNETPHKYYEAVNWDDLKRMFEELKPFLVFSVRNVKIMDENPTHETIGFFGDKSTNSANKTTVFSFNYTTVQNLNDDTKQTENQTVVNSKVVFVHPGKDNSGPLSIKFLMLHFIGAVKIKAMFFFDFKNDETNNFDLFAMVYTSEPLNEKTHHFRQYMKTDRFDFHEFPTLYYFDWTFDDLADYCDAIDRTPLAVVFLRKEFSGEKQIIYFAEFYGTFHKILKLTYKMGKYTLDIIDGEISNFDTLIECTHPAFKKGKVIPCREEDYKTQNFGESVGEETVNSLIYWIAIVTTIAAIVCLIGVVVYSIVAKNQTPPN